MKQGFRGGVEPQMFAGTDFREVFREIRIEPVTFFNNLLNVELTDWLFFLITDTLPDGAWCLTLNRRLSE
ncbi:MAG TPA: hypothetical protein DCM07_23410 [Planctomycetaceae bacterium]|nr:hypothetical protein [Planctomycetaceae bacterium]HBL42817.1 hypothetical protein [Planctomycetaceae bacterium]